MQGFLSSVGRHDLFGLPKKLKFEKKKEKEKKRNSITLRTITIKNYHSRRTTHQLGKLPNSWKDLVVQVSNCIPHNRLFQRLINADLVNPTKTTYI